jgi:hypothetical protein
METSNSSSLASSRRWQHVWLACAATLLGGCFRSEGNPAGPIDVWVDNIVGHDGGTDDSDDPDDSDDSDDPQDEPDDSQDSDDSEAPSCVARLVANKDVRAKLDVCRTCHVARGIAAKSSFVLTKDTSMDEARLRAAFEEVGHDLLAMPAMENGLKHPGGARLTKGTAAYVAWKAMVAAFDDPDSCSDAR